MKQYIKNGKIKYKNLIIVYKNKKQIINPKEETILEDGWIEYIPVKQESTITLTDEEKFNNAKLELIKEILYYDNSDEVNNCYINYQDQQISYWANKQERSVLKTAIQDCITFGRENYRLDLRELNISIELNCKLLLQMLAALEVYAIDCYNVTTDHLFNIKKIETLEELYQYDYKKSYPEKLIFNI